MADRYIGRDDRWEDREYDFLNGGGFGLGFFCWVCCLFIFLLACLLLNSTAPTPTS